MKGEADLVQDTLTCGVCQKDFPLSEIVRFIQHKVHSCNKENCLLFGDSDTEDLVLSARRPPISVPIIRKEAPARRDLTPPNSEDNGDKEDPVDYVPLKTLTAKDSVDDEAKVNGTSEPHSYVCSTCKQTHSSAWALVQHVQHVHGLKIYVDSSPAKSPSLAISSAGDQNEKVAERNSSPSQHPLHGLRVPLLERQLDATSLFSRPSSQELRLDLLGLSSNNNNNSNHPASGTTNTTSTTPASTPAILDGTQATADNSHSATGLGLSYEPQLDFYSQRLRQLAGATSPNSALSSRKLLSSSFSALLSKPLPQSTTPPQQQQPLLSTASQLQQSSASSTSSKASSDQPPQSPKHKSCEFCGKSFRFQSNLIVHRRSHTGEKPYKCHKCNHACSQASKLKRHMKTHRKKKKKSSSSSGATTETTSRVEENSGHCNRESACSTPDCTNSKDGRDKDGGEEKQTNGEHEDYISDEHGADNEEEVEDEEDEEEEEEEEEDEDDVEDEDEEEEEEEEEEVEVEIADEEEERNVNADREKKRKREDRNDMMAEDLTTKTLTNDESGNNLTSIIEVENDTHNESKKDKRENNIARHSLLSEVMEKIGLAHIQQYSEAYKQALKESSISKSSFIKHERLSSGTDGSASNDANANHSDDAPERPPREGTRSAGQSPLSFGTGLLSAFDQSLGIKRLKLDAGESWRDKDRENNLYAGLWLPSVTSSTYRDLYMGITAGDSLDRRKSSTESALNSTSPGGGGRSGSPRPGPSGSGGRSSSALASSLLKPKDNRRNDTCEFCGKVFKNCSNLTVHRRSHTGEKPYKCELCSYACAQSSKLTRHMKTHGRVGKDVYRCRFCDMPFSVPSTLEKHMRKCVVSQSGSYLLSERDSDSKEMTL